MILLLYYYFYCLFDIDLQQMNKPDHDQITPVVVKMLNFTDKQEEWISSPFFVYDGGYQMCLRVDAAGNGDGEGTHVSVYLHLMKGPHDDKLEQSDHWPLRGTFTIELLNQLNDNDHYTRSMLLSGYLCSECINRVVEGDMVTGVGFDQFISHDIIPDYVNHLNDALHFRITYDNNDPPPVNQVPPLIMNMSKFAEKKKNKEQWYSSPFFAFDGGYLMCVHIYAAGYGDGEGAHVSVYLHLMKGPYDDKLEQSGHWPLRGTFTIEILNQLNHSDHYTHNIVMYDYLRRQCSGREVEDYMNSMGRGYRKFVSHNIILKYLKDDTLSFRIKYEDISSPFIPNNQVAPVILVMPNFTEMKNKKKWCSNPFFAFTEGYQMCLSVYAAGYGDGEGTHVSVYLHLMKGPHDDKLEQSGHWPLRGTFAIELLNQFTGNDHYTRSMLLSGYLCSECINRVVEGDMVTGVGFDQFISHDIIPDYVNHLMDDALQFRITYDNNDPPPVNQVPPLIMNMSKFAEKKKNREQWYSSPFFAFDGGYLMCVHIYAAGYGDGEGAHVSVFLHLLKGPHDDKLEQSGHWPLRGTFIIEILNQLNHSDHYSHNIVMCDYLRRQCSEREVEDYMNSMGRGYRKFVSHNIIFYNKADEYLKEDTLSFRIKFEDISSPFVPNNQVAPVILVMPKFTEKMKNKTHWYSSPFLTFTGGYQMCLRVVTVGYYSDEDTDVSVLLYLMKGPHDDKLEQSGHWPLRGTFTIELLNQLNDSDHFIYTLSLYHYLCNKCSTRVTDGDVAPKGWGSKYYISRKAILHQNSKQYFYNDALHFRISYEDTSPSTPHDQVAPVVFKLCNVTSKVKKNELWFSVPFFAFKEGYKMSLVLRMGGYKTGEGTHVSFYVRPMKGPHDDKLEQSCHWPLRGTFTIELLNQLNDSDHHSHKANMDSNKCSYCTSRVLKNNIAPTGWGSHRFISHKAIFQDDRYFKNDCVDFRISYEDTGYSTSPHQITPVIMRMDNVAENIKNNDRWYSDHFLAFTEGYKLHLKVYGSGYDDGEGTHLSVFLCLMKGPHDDKLDWPLSGTFVIELLDQSNNSDHYIRTVVIHGCLYRLCTKRVRQTDISDTVPKCCHFKFISHETLDRKTSPLYLKNDSLLFRISYEHTPLMSMSHQAAPLVLNISDFTKRLKRREHWSSSPFYTFEGGYQMCISIDFASGNDNENTYILTVSLHLLNGPYDDELQQSGQWPLSGVFLIELQYHYGCNEYYYHKQEIYFISNETCRSCVTLKDDVAEGYGNDYIISSKHLHAGLKNDEIHLSISYSSCYSCVFIWNWSLEDLVAFTGLWLLDGLFTFLLLAFIKACRILIEDSNMLSLAAIVEYNVIAQTVFQHTLKMSLFIISTVIGKALTFILWEFTHVINYNNAIVMSDMINIIRIIIQLVNVHLSSRAITISPVWMTYIFSETCSTLLIITLILAVVIMNICLPFCIAISFTYRFFKVLMDET